MGAMRTVYDRQIRQPSPSGCSPTWTPALRLHRALSSRTPASWRCRRKQRFYFCNLEALSSLHISYDFGRASGKNSRFTHVQKQVDTLGKFMGVTTQMILPQGDFIEKGGCTAHVVIGTPGKVCISESGFNRRT